MGFVAGGLGDFTCGTSLTIDILRLAARNHNLTNKYIKYFIFVTFYLKKNKEKTKKLDCLQTYLYNYTSNYKLLFKTSISLVQKILKSLSKYLQTKKILTNKILTKILY